MIKYIRIAVRVHHKDQSIILAFEQGFHSHNIGGKAYMLDMAIKRWTTTSIPLRHKIRFIYSPMAMYSI